MVSDRHSDRSFDWTREDRVRAFMTRFSLLLLAELGRYNKGSCANNAPTPTCPPSHQLRNLQLRENVCNYFENLLIVVIASTGHRPFTPGAMCDPTLSTK